MCLSASGQILQEAKKYVLKLARTFPYYKQSSLCVTLLSRYFSVSTVATSGKELLLYLDHSTHSPAVGLPPRRLAVTPDVGSEAPPPVAQLRPQNPRSVHGGGVCRWSRGKLFE